LSAAPLEVGRYVLYDLIASGGMAAVHFGRITGSAGFMRVVAIKRLHPHLASDKKFTAMFLDEARVASRIHHPNVVGVIDVADLDGELFLVMDYVRGESLSTLLRAAAEKDELVPLAIASAVMIGALYGLHAAHEARDERGELMHVVHRDVSPQNILVDLDGVVRVADFGIAKAVSRLESTRDGEVKGKLAYMAPEQLISGAVDRRTDVYAASVVLWEAVTGQRLFQRGDPGAIVLAVMSGGRPPPSIHRAGIDTALDGVVLRGLSHAQASRFPTTLEMAEALAEVVKPASPREVAAWVARMGGAALDERLRRVTELERETAPVPGGLHAMLADRQRLTEAVTAVGESNVAEASRSSSPLDAISAPPRPAPVLPAAASGPLAAPQHDPRRRRAYAPLVAFVVVAGLAAAVLGVRQNRWLSVSSAASSLAVPSAASAAVTAAAIAVEAESASPASAAAAASIASATSSPSSASSAPTPARHASPHVDRRTPPAAHRAPATPSTAPAATAKNDCDPPFTIDENGIKRFKRWCPQ
jgi:serine/threonine protein kinase